MALIKHSAKSTDSSYECEVNMWKLTSKVCVLLHFTFAAVNDLMAVKMAAQAGSTCICAG